MEKIVILDTNKNNIHEFAMCGYKNLKMEGYRRKVEWLKKRFTEGLKHKVLFSEKQGAIGAIEYVPGAYSWRAVNAAGYMFIHCIYIMKREYKGKGYGQQMLEQCLADAEKNKMQGVAVVTRQGSWMVSKELFIKKSFTAVEQAEPDYELLVLKFNKNAPDPKFSQDQDKTLNKYKNGLYLFSSDQCPYCIKAVTEISETAEKKYQLKPQIIQMNSSKQARQTPCAFGSFCIVYNGQVIAPHPISNTRFCNIMNKLQKDKMF